MSKNSSVLLIYQLHDLYFFNELECDSTLKTSQPLLQDCPN